MLLLLNKTALATMVPEQWEKEDAACIAQQQPVICVCTELTLVSVIRNVPSRSRGEWIMKALRDLVCLFPDANMLNMA